MLTPAVCVAARDRRKMPRGRRERRKPKLGTALRRNDILTGRSQLGFDPALRLYLSGLLRRRSSFL